MSALSQLGRSAVNLARYGYGVFPLWPRAKTPATGTGFKAATTDTTRVEQWWSRGPESNIGLAVPDDIVILDVDSAEAMAELQNQKLELPRTVTTKTPRGTHFWYRVAPGTEMHPRAGVFPGVDIRSRGSYVVVPPSVNKDGVSYTWEVKPYRENFSEAPGWLVELAKQGALNASAAGPEGAREAIKPEDVLGGVAVGARDWTLFRYACRLRTQGRPRAEAEVLVTTAAARCSPAFPHDEALAKVAQAWKYEAPADDKDTTAEEFKIWSVSELCSIAWPEPRWLIQDILTEGLTLMYSPAKVGKSFLAGALAMAIASGGRALDRFPTRQTGVLYLDLEQSEAKAKRRWGQISRTGLMPAGLHTVFRWPSMDRGCVDRLRHVMDMQPDIGAIFVDVLSCIWPEEKGKTGSAYHAEYRIMSALRDFAQDAHVALVLIHHTKKGDDVDMLSRASGSTAMVGVPGGIWCLSRERGKTNGQMLVTGRDLLERTLHLGWDPSIGSWIVESEDGPDPVFAPRPRGLRNPGEDEEEERQKW